MDGNRELKGKIANFSGDLSWLDDAEAAAYAAAGAHLELVTGSIPGLDAGGSVTIRHEDVDREVKGPSGWSVSYSYVLRTGYTPPDFVFADFIKDGAFHDMDLSAIVPSGAKFAHVEVRINAAEQNRRLFVIGKGEAEPLFEIICYADRPAFDMTERGFPKMPASRIVSYMAEVATWSQMTLTVLGWVI